MMRIQSEPNGRPQPMPRAKTGPFIGRLIEAKANLVTAVLAGQSCYVQGDNAPLRYRLLTDTALRLTEFNQQAAYFDLSDLAYQYDLATWVKNSIRLLAIQLNLPLPTVSWWAEQSETDPTAVFLQFLEECILSQGDKPVLLSFDEADQLLQAPLAEDFWRLLGQIRQAQEQKREFKQLTLVLWGKASWQQLAGNGRFPTNALKQIIL
jgi:hypothetical protein